MKSDSCSHRTDVIKTSDGLELFSQSWVPPSPRGTILLVHGLAEHSSRYSSTAEHLAEAGWAVYACDLRSHGLSPDGHRPGRVHVDHFEDYEKDVNALLALAKKRHPNLPRVILGHSMGGLIALTYTLNHPDALNGAVISSPALGTHPDSQPPRALKLVVGLLSRLTPHALFASKLDTDAVSRDPAVVEAYVSDPLISAKVSARWFDSFLKAMASARHRAASLRVPMLLMQSGDDTVVDPAEPGRWAETAPSGLVELVVWKGLYHEMLNEPEKDQVRARISEWLEKNIA
jgi:acylglycerol lipase